MFSVGSNTVEYEKDPMIQNLRQSVANQMWSIIQQEEPAALQPAKEEIKFVSFEDALKELAALKHGSQF